MEAAVAVCGLLHGLLNQVAAKLGATSPQATAIREVYLLAVVDAAYDRFEDRDQEI